MNSTKLPPSWRPYIWMPAVTDKMYQMAGELLLNTSDSQISVAFQTMMSLKSNKILPSSQKTNAGNPAHCPAAFETWDWEVTLKGKHSTWKIREIRAHVWFNSGNQITWQKTPKFQIEAATKESSTKTMNKMAALWTRSWGTTIQVSGHFRVICAHFICSISRKYLCTGNEKAEEKQKKNNLKSAEKSLQPEQDSSSAPTLLQPGSPRRGGVSTVYALNKRLNGNMKAYSSSTANIFDKTKSQKLHCSLEHNV